MTGVTVKNSVNYTAEGRVGLLSSDDYLILLFRYGKNIPNNELCKTNYYNNVRSKLSLSFLLFKCFKTHVCGKFNSSLQINGFFAFLIPGFSH